MAKKKLIGKKKLTINSIVSKKPRREALDQIDAQYLSNRDQVSLGERLGGGGYSTFYEVKGNNRLGVKVPRCPHEYYAEKPPSCSNCENKRDLLYELEQCKKHGFNEKQFLCPTHDRALTVRRDGKMCIGLVKPLMTEVTWGTSKTLTDSQLETIRQGLISLSIDGLALEDNLQFGFTESGRLLQFDLGDVKKTTPSKAFAVNSQCWHDLLRHAHKFLQYDTKDVFKKYGEVRP